MTSDGTNTYVWDARDRLVQIKTGASVNASFAYDALGRRSTCTVGSATTKFLYDGLNPIQEQSASNAATANLLTGLGVDGFISRTTISDGLTVHFLPDALNSTLALTDSSGAVSTSYTYEPFGKATKTGAATTNTFGFTGREDDGTGLMYYRARYYNPSTQRFISEDPIGLMGGSTIIHMR
jgi:RHS repeat-associated protein